MAAPAAAAASSQSTDTSHTSLAPVPQSNPQQQPATTPQRQQQRPQQLLGQQQQPQTTTLQQSQPQSQSNTSHPPLPSLILPPSHPASLASVQSPSKTSLTNWWKGFKSKPLFKKPEEQEQTAPKGIFGVSLTTSIRYAFVNISITNASGNHEVYGRIPVIVAKCGVYLKDKATDVEGIFRVSGSAKRIKELQSVFDSPPTYGKTLDWEGYNVHDAANVFRRYINHLPEPIIPYEHYFAFRKPLESENPNVEETVKEYQRLIGELPKLNGQLLLYILDLLAVFAENSAANLMPAANLAAIFQPGLLSHPDHDMTPKEYRVSQEVLVFLIEHQDRFLPTSAVRGDQPPSTSSQQSLPQSQQQQQVNPPATYQGTSLSANQPHREINIPRRRTIPKLGGNASPSITGKVLRRHRSTRVPESPRLAVESEEPRRVSEGSAPTTPIPLQGDFEPKDDVLLSSPVTNETQLPHTEQQTDETKQSTDNEPSTEQVPDVVQVPADIEPTPGIIEPPNEEDGVNEEVEPEVNHHVEEPKSTNHTVSSNVHLTVTAQPMGRSSSYREELDEIIDYEEMTSADNTEAEGETSDTLYKPIAKLDKKKGKRKSKLPWSSSSDLGEARGSGIFNFNSSDKAIGKNNAEKEGDSPSKLQSGQSTPTRRLQKRNKKNKGSNEAHNALGIAMGGSIKSPESEFSQSERGLGTLSPQPWTEGSNISQTSLNASEFSRRSQISSSNRSSAEGLPRSETPVDRTNMATASPITLEALQHSNDDLPTDVVMPAAREERRRTGSHSSRDSSTSVSKVARIGAWLRQKRGYSVSSSTSAGGGGSAVSD